MVLEVLASAIRQQKEIKASFFFFKDFIYLTERNTAREGTQAEGMVVGEAGFLLSREPDVGLDPRPLGSDLGRRQMLND